MRGSLFWRTYSVLLTVLLLTIAIFSGMVVAARQQGLQDSYETEVRMQAREVADYMTHLNQLSLVRGDITMQYIIQRKITEIYQRYSADIWIVSYNSGIVQYLDKTWNTSESIASEAVSEHLSIIQSGKEIRSTGLFPELGAQIVTIGVPWFYSNGDVVGAVLLHIPNQFLHVSLLDTLYQFIPPALLALLVGAVMSFFLARSQVDPLREINSAVREFSKGDLSRRVNIDCGGELEELGDSINQMATELSQLEESRRSFVANVSHELRSPMTSMSGYVQAMLDGTIPAEDMPRYLGIVKAETDRLRDLVHDLLDLSRLESGKFPLAVAPFDANELMRRNLINFEQRISAKSIDVDVQLGEDPLYAMGDANRINQVISNMIDNAVKFMDGEGSVLTVCTRREGKNVRFIVADNGAGINPEDLPHIFERFYKADKAHTSGMGTGLGLSICQWIMRLHDSKITASSSGGKTVFEFTLPAAEMPDNPQRPAINGGQETIEERSENR